jgi:hypothetical protein
MHTPTVVVFDIHVPWVRLSAPWRNDSKRWGVERRRYSPTCTPPEKANRPMYRPWRPAAWLVHVNGKLARWATLATVWHQEPTGHDSGTVCKGMGGSDLTWHNVVWAVGHRRHLHVQVHPYQRISRWLFARCAECGRRFFWRDARFGYMSSDDVYHDQCMSLRQLRSQKADLLAYVTHRADRTQKWRVDRMADSLGSDS